MGDITATRSHNGSNLGTCHKDILCGFVFDEIDGLMNKRGRGTDAALMEKLDQNETQNAFREVHCFLRPKFKAGIKSAEDSSAIPDLEITILVYVSRLALTRPMLYLLSQEENMSCT